MSKADCTRIMTAFKLYYASRAPNSPAVPVASVKQLRSLLLAAVAMHRHENQKVINMLDDHSSVLPEGLGEDFRDFDSKLNANEIGTAVQPKPVATSRAPTPTAGSPLLPVSTNVEDHSVVDVSGFNSEELATWLESVAGKVNRTVVDRVLQHVRDDDVTGEALSCFMYVRCCVHCRIRCCVPGRVRCRVG